ncbi:hypothetical protein SO802_025291 [Lithocarpus litseifolius]|uniref:Uncharacterized protein n=1 Tax=Lithocarpus litseifolius TaxID=425828 RepID=A0AAW2BWQ3_9ROSI
MKRSKTRKPPDIAGRQKVAFGLNFGFISFANCSVPNPKGGEEVLKLQKDGKAQREKWLNNCKQLCTIWSGPNHGGSFSLASLE